MNPNWNPTVRAISAGIAAALVALLAAILSGEGVNAAELVQVALAFLAGAGLTQAAAATSELKAVRREQMSVRETINRRLGPERR